MGDMDMTSNTRREFLKQAAIGAAALAAYPAPSVLGANDRVRVGMIGVGGRGEELLKEILQVPNVQLVAIADVYSRRRDAAKQMAPGIQTFDDHRRLLDRKELDGVIVASPLHIHARHFMDVIAEGKDLYCEKTMTWSIPEAEECLTTAKKSDRVVQVGVTARKFRSTGGYTQVDQGRPGRQDHASRILDEPQHVAWKRPMGASSAFRLYRAKRRLEGFSERPARPRV